MNTKYFSDLLFLSPSFNQEEKKKIFIKYSQNETLLQEGIKILEEELQKIVAEYMDFEEKKLIAAAEFLKNFDNLEQSLEEKQTKIEQILREQKLREEAEKSDFINTLNII